MKKIISMLILINILILTACSGQASKPISATEPASTESVPAVVSDSPSPTPELTPTPEPKKEFVLYISYESKAISSNMVEDKSKRLIYITLPPSYYDNTDKSYPVIYFLHGHGDPPGAVSSRSPAMTKLMKSGDLKEYITVEPDCGSVLGGSFYANSPVTGGFEDFITEELVIYIDENYRTIADASSRGIAGFSMGGFGAMYIGFRHPDLFSALYALSPGLFDPDGVKSAISKSWDINLEKNYGAVFSPDTSLPFPYANIPVFDGSDNDNKIIADWYNGFGNWEQKIKDYQALPDKLNAIEIRYGKSDNYPFIIDGCKYVSDLLNEAGIDHTLDLVDGGHTIAPTFVTSELLPFFDNNLEGE